MKKLMKERSAMEIQKECKTLGHTRHTKIAKCPSDVCQLRGLTALLRCLRSHHHHHWRKTDRLHHRQNHQQQKQKQKLQQKPDLWISQSRPSTRRQQCATESGTIPRFWRALIPVPLPPPLTLTSSSIATRSKSPSVCGSGPSLPPTHTLTHSLSLILSSFPPSASALLCSVHLWSSVDWLHLRRFPEKQLDLARPQWGEGNVERGESVQSLFSKRTGNV